MWSIIPNKISEVIPYLFAGEDELSEDEEDTVDKALLTTTDFDNTERESWYDDSKLELSFCFCTLVLMIWGLGGLNQS